MPGKRPQDPPPITGKFNQPKKDNLTLSQIQATLNTFLENLDSPAFCLDTEYRYTCFNSHHAVAMKALYNADIEIGVSIFHYLYTEEDQQKEKINLDKALTGEHITERAYSGDHILSRKFFEISHSPIREQDGEIIGVLVIAKYAVDQATLWRDLDESNARFAGIVANSAAGIVFTDCDGNYLFANDAFLELSGYTGEELTHLRLGDLVHPDDAELERSLLDEIKNHRRAEFRMELRIRTKSGSECWGDLSISAIFDEDKNPVNFIGVVKDITEKKRDESYLASLNALKEDLLKSESTILKLKKITDGIVDIFQADFARIWIIKNSDLCNSGCIYAHPTNGQDNCINNCLNQDRCLHLASSSGRYTHRNGKYRRIPLECNKIGEIATGEEKQFVTNNVTDDPRICDRTWAESLGLTAFAGFRLLSQSLEPVGVLTLFRKNPILPDEIRFLEDLAHTSSLILISGEMDRTLHENEDFLGSIIENIPDMVFVKDAKNLRFIKINKAGEEILGYRRDELIGKNDYDFFPKEEADFYIENDRKTLSGHSVIDIPKEEILTLQKGKRTLHTKKLPVFDQSGERKFLLGISEDITEKIEIEAERDKLKTQLEYLLGVTKTRIEIIDQNFNLVYVDPAWSLIYGDFRGKKCYEYFHDLTLPCQECKNSQALKTGEVIVTEKILQKEGGRIVEVHTIPIQEPDGEWFVAKFNIDLTEQKRTQNLIDNYAKDLEYLSRRSLEMLDLDDDSDIFAFISSTIKKLAPPGSIVIIGEVDTGSRSITTRSIEGLKPLHLEFLGDLGPSLTNRSYPLNDKLIEYMITGGLRELPYGFRTLSGNTFPEEVYQKIEESGLIEKIYFAGLSWKKNLQGSVIIILPPGVDLNSIFRCEIFLQLSAIELIRRKITAELREERGLFIDGPIVVFKWEAREGWPVQYVSPNIQSQFGYLPEDFLRGVIPYASIIHPDDIDRVIDEINKFSAEGKPIYEQEYRIKRADGQFRWIYDFTVLERDKVGTIYAYHGYILDINDRKMTEHLLRESEENARTLINAPKDSIFIMKPDGTIQYTNETAALRLGKTVDEMLGRSVFLMLPQEVAVQRKQYVNQMVRSKEPFSFTDERFGRIIENNLYPILGDDGEVSRIAVYGYDITEKIDANRKIAESEAKYRELVQNASSIIIRIDPEGRILVFNEYAQEFFGYSEAEIIGQNIIGTIFEKTDSIGSDNEKIVQGILNSPDRFTFYENESITREGRRVWISWRNKPIYLEGVFAGILSVGTDITERKQMEEALRILAEISDKAPVAITVHDLDGKIYYVNDEGCKFHGYTREEYLSLNLHQLDVPESNQLISERLHHILEKGEGDFDVRHYRKDGSIIPLHINAKIVTWEGKKVLLSIGTDLTERENAQKMLRMSEEKYRSVVEHTHDGIVIVHGNAVIFANEAFAKMSGYSPDELGGIGYLQLVRKEDMAKIQEFIARSITSKEVSTSFENLLVRRDTTTFPVEINGNRIEYQGLASTLLVIRDISERKHAEEEQLKILNLLNETQELTKLGGWEYDVLKENMSWTNEVYHIHGVGYEYDPQNLQEDISFYTPENRHIIDNAFYRAVHEGIPYDLELIFRRADGRQIWVRTIGSPVLEDGRIIRVTGNIMDITERKQLEISLREALQKLKVLTRITRHDVVNDITAITLSLEIVQDADDEETKQKYLDKALAEAKILEETIGFTREYEDFGSISGNWYKILEIVTSAKSGVELGAISVDLGLSSDLEIFSDPIIRKVFTTLLENSIRHGGENLSIIKMYTRKEKGNLVIVYEDNGIGIPLQDKEHIFAHGFGKHTGIGLFLAREILSITGFSIKECGVEGEGARFEILVPNGGYRYLS